MKRVGIVIAILTAASVLSAAQVYTEADARAAVEKLNQRGKLIQRIELQFHGQTNTTITKEKPQTSASIYCYRAVRDCTTSSGWSLYTTYETDKISSGATSYDYPSWVATANIWVADEGKMFTMEAPPVKDHPDGVELKWTEAGRPMQLSPDLFMTGCLTYLNRSGISTATVSGIRETTVLVDGKREVLPTATIGDKRSMSVVCLSEPGLLSYRGTDANFEIRDVVYEFTRVPLLGLVPKRKSTMSTFGGYVTIETTSELDKLGVNTEAKMAPGVGATLEEVLGAFPPKWDTAPPGFEDMSL